MLVVQLCKFTENQYIVYLQMGESYGMEIIE